MISETVEEVARELRSFGEAYPTDIFPEFTDIELKAYSAVISRASAGMGRHMAKVMARMAEKLEKANV